MPHAVAGVTNLPYLNNVVTGVLHIAVPDVLPNKSPFSGNPGNSGYAPSDKLTVPGLAAVLQLPVVWNPHDPRSSLGATGATPTRIRVVADSTTPDQAERSGGTHNSFFVYAQSLGAGIVGTEPDADSYAASGTSPDSSWYRSTSGTGSDIAHALTANNSSIEVRQLSGSKPLFSEPTMLVTPGTITDINGNTVQIAVGAGARMQTESPVSSHFSSGGLLSYNDSGGYLNKPANSPHVGFYLGAIPLAWISQSGVPLSAAQSGAFIARVTSSGPNKEACYVTYRMQYLDPATNKWVTYDTTYGKVGSPTQLKVPAKTTDSQAESLLCGCGRLGAGDPGAGGYWSLSVDPRSGRFGLLLNGTFSAPGGTNGPFNGDFGRETIEPLPAFEFVGDSGGWINATDWTTLTLRPDLYPGFFSVTGWPYNSSSTPTTVNKVHTSSDGTSSGWMAWTTSDGQTCPGLAVGSLSQNNSSAQYNFHRFDGDHGDSHMQTPQYFADADGIVRRAMGGFVPPMQNWTAPAATTTGLPMARAFQYVSAAGANATKDVPSSMEYHSPTQVTSQAQSRPFMLHRPFRTVAELGYVFSDTPWRNLDLSTAESGNAALLDTFCINDSTDADALVAGKLNLNTRQVPVLKAVLASSYFDPILTASAATATSAADSRIDASTSATATASLLANALIVRTTGNTGNSGPLRNVGELVGRWISNTAIAPLPYLDGSPLHGVLSSGLHFYDGKTSYSGFSDNGGWDVSNRTPKLSTPAIDVYSVFRGAGALASVKDTVTNVQRFREAPIRALAAVGQTRVWNLMIDVVAQTGRFPQNPGGLSSFIVQGERRYWVHIAIDRFTGQVIDKQVEVVKE